MARPQNANLYRNENRFYLIDEEGIVLAPGEELRIAEPFDLESVEFTLLRDSEYHGFDFEFASEESEIKLRFKPFQGETNNARDLANDIFNLRGPNGKLIFSYRFQNGMDEVELFRGYVLYHTRRRQRKYDAYQCDRITFGGGIQSRKSLSVPFGATESISGAPITGITPYNIFLHSQVLEKTLKATSLGPVGEVIQPQVFRVDIPAGSGTELVDKRFYLNASLEADPNTKLSDGFKSPSSQFVPDSLSAARQFEAQEGGTYDIDIQAKYSGEITIIDERDGTNLACNGGLFQRIRLFSYVRIDDAEGNAIQPPVVLWSYDYDQCIEAPGTPTDTHTIIAGSPYESGSGNYSATRDLPPGASIYVYCEWRYTGEYNSPALVKDEISATVAGRLNNDGSININAETKAPADTSQGVKPITALNHIGLYLTDNADIIDSPHFDTSGDAHEFTLVGGKQLRSLDVQPEFSFESMVGSLKAIFGVGMSTYNNGVTERMYIGRFTDFYRDQRILDSNGYPFTVNSLIEWSSLCDTENTYNTIRVGYSVYSEGSETDEPGARNEFNAYHQKSTQLNQLQNEGFIESLLVASGQKLEAQRRLGPNDDSGDSDDELFVINDIEQSTFLFEVVNARGGNLIIDAYLPQLVDATEITLVTQGDVYTVVSGTGNAVQVPKPQTSWQVNELTPNETYYNEEVSFDISILASVQDETFDIASGTVGAPSAYNKGIAPTYMLFNHSPLINSGLAYEGLTSEIVTSFVKNNGSLRTQFKVGEGAYILDPDRQVVTQGDTITKADLDQGQGIHTGVAIEIETELSIQDVFALRQQYTGRPIDGTNYGWFEIKDAITGELTPVYLRELRYRAYDRVCTMKCWIKA